MTVPNFDWLNEDEVLFDRMEKFHRHRVEAISVGESPLGKREDGFLVAHLIPRSSVLNRKRFDGSMLMKHGIQMAAFGDTRKYSESRFNVDGLLQWDGGQHFESYSQIYRDGRNESVMSDITFQFTDEPSNAPKYLRDSICEKAVLQLVKDYSIFCMGIGIQPPFTLFSALINCKGVRFHNQRTGSSLKGVIDRTPAFLPEVEVTKLDADPARLLRPWCNTLFQAMGMEKSFNFDEAGEWRERR